MRDNKKRIGKVGWMPFWWGNKFNKRLASKRARKHLRRKEKEEL